MRVPYNGGPVVSCPILYASFWGSYWQTKREAITAQATLTAFLGDLVHSTWMNVLAQYGVSGGMFAQAQNFILPQDPNGTAQDGKDGLTLSTDACEQNLLGMIHDHTLPPPGDPRNGPPVVICFLNDHVTTDRMPGNFGYHEHLVTPNGQPLIYAFVAWRNSIDDMTETASHELAEMATNPLGSGKPRDHLNGWIIPNDRSGTEIADKDDGLLCQMGAHGFITEDGNTWKVTSMWSDVDDGCKFSADSPIPPIHPGPFSLATTMDAESHPDARLLRHLTPFPPMHIDPKTNRPYMKKTDLFAYYRKLFHPLRHERVFPGFPTFLRELASVLERGADAAEPGAGVQGTKSQNH
jgi:hypothetical protein